MSLRNSWSAPAAAAFTAAFTAAFAAAPSAATFAGAATTRTAGRDLHARRQAQLAIGDHHFPLREAAFNDHVLVDLARYRDLAHVDGAVGLDDVDVLS